MNFTAPIEFSSTFKWLSLPSAMGVPGPAAAKLLPKLTGTMNSSWLEDG